MVVSNAASSDLELARQLSRDLSQPPAEGPPTLQPHYVAFPHVPTGRTTARCAAPVKAPAPERRDDGSIGAEAWAKLLPWACSVTAQHGAFVLDQHGLIVASHGELPHNLEEAAARISIAFDQAMALAGDHQIAMALELDKGWLTALRVPVFTGEGSLVLVLSGEEAPPRSARTFVAQSLSESLG